MRLSPVASRYGMKYVIAITFTVDQDREDPLANIVLSYLTLVIYHLATPS